MRGKNYYKKLFENYQDVVDITTFMEMLGGINKKTAFKLLREKNIKSFVIKMRYCIPKVYIIEYLLSEHYAEHKDEMKAKV